MGTIYIRDEGGGIQALDEPISEGITHRIAKGEIVRVNEDGTTWEPDPEEIAISSATEAEELRAAHADILAENAGLSDEVAQLTKQRDEAIAELEQVTKERDDLAAEVGQLKEQLAEVTKQRDEAIQDEEAAAAKPPTSSRAKSTK